MDNVLPCPFCGAQPAVVDDDSYGGSSVACVTCENAATAAEAGDVNRAIEEWNRRAPEEREYRVLWDFDDHEGWDPGARYMDLPLAQMARDEYAQDKDKRQRPHPVPACCWPVGG